MDRFLNLVKAQAGAMDQMLGQPRFGIVTSVDTKSYTVRVLLQPEGVLSGWLPVLSAAVGSGWGVVCPPVPGQQVLVLTQEGAAEHGVVVGASFSNQAQPPDAPSGEMWLVHQTGTFLKLHNDGTVEGVAQRWNLTGDVHVAGSIFATGDVSDRIGALNALRQIYDGHTHTDSHGDVTSVPLQQD